MKSVNGLAVLAVIVSLAVTPASDALQGSYPQVGNGPGHLGVASGGGPTQLSSPRFSVGGKSWIGQAGVVAGLGKVIGLANSLDPQGQPCTAVVAVQERTGQVAWTANVPATFGTSWSRPSIDEQFGMVLVAQGDRLVALRISDGSQAWFMPAGTGKYFVNVCPTVYGGIVYIADYVSQTDTTSISKLYAVNVSTGQLLWQMPVGRTSGANTAAVSGSKVMLATYEGKFLTFDRLTGTAYPELVLDVNGFFGGVTAEGNSAYIVSFAFSALNGPTKLYKIDISASTPTKVWEAVAPRSDAMPVVAGNLVLVSGGDGYSKFRYTEWDIDWPSLWAFDKTTGQFLWKTETAGGWTSQPVYASGLVYAVTQVGQFTGSTSSLYVLDPSKAPTDPAFVVTSTSQIGNSVAIANGNVYGTSPTYLKAFGPAIRIPGDINGDGYVNVGDLQMLIAAWGSSSYGGGTYNPNADFNGDGWVNVGDLQILVAQWGAGG